MVEKPETIDEHKAAERIPVLPPDGLRWLSKIQLAGYLGLSRIRRVDELRKADPTFPEPILLSKGTPKWDRQEVDPWLAARPRGYSSAGGYRAGAFKRKAA